jgi:acyl-CoA synthetase (AMP-forming)/AMP-acid ligase II
VTVLVHDYLDRGFHLAPDAPCMEAPDGTVLMTHRDLHDASVRIAAQLVADGLQVGDRVAIFSPNDPWAFACVVGVLRAGGTWTAVNAASAEDDLVAFLTLAGCSRLIYHAALTERADGLLARLPEVRTAVAIGAGRPGDPSLEDWLPPTGTAFTAPETSPSSPAMLAGTGGTTGVPKAVPLTHKQITVMCLAFNAHLHETEPPRFICAAPMTHAAGGAAFPVLAEGGSVIIHQGVVPADVLESIERNRASRIYLPPTALYALLAHPDAQKRDVSSLQHFLIASSPVSPDRLAEAVRVFGPVLTQVYGQSEAPFICTVLSREDIAAAVADDRLQRRLASCGRSSLVARVEIMADDGTLLGPDEEGEIVVRSPLVFDGYWQNPEATAETRRPGGWHGTGDVGVRDADGYVYVVDRKKDMIITGGFNVYPSEVEKVIHTLPEVNDCAVIGVPDDKWGEAVVAVIEPKPDATVDPDAVLAACKSALGSVKTPKQVILRTLPRSAVGKVLKRELREEFWAGRDRRV